MELIVQPGSVAVNKRLKNLKFPKGTVLGAIVRGEDVIIPGGDQEIKVFDRLIVFALSKNIHKVERLFLHGGRK
ncbi:MAG TPA: hypothetical protein GX404_06235 [Syntrophomonadaceae bacterium]|nr:hypothetical protein [Syntrophomonadaceae bacterium]